MIAPRRLSAPPENYLHNPVFSHGRAVVTRRPANPPHVYDKAVALGDTELPRRRRDACDLSVRPSGGDTLDHAGQLHAPRLVSNTSAPCYDRAPSPRTTLQANPWILRLGLVAVIGGFVALFAWLLWDVWYSSRLRTSPTTCKRSPSLPSPVRSGSASRSSSASIRRGRPKLEGQAAGVLQRQSHCHSRINRLLPRVRRGNVCVGKTARRDSPSSSGPGLDRHRLLGRGVRGGGSRSGHYRPFG